jgi:hypothetical protein
MADDIAQIQKAAAIGTPICEHARCDECNAQKLALFF